tara:strand:- start:485 stop:1948 length:1464 start_codon:yes stop_codon:yes gene_type:complete
MTYPRLLVWWLFFLFNGFIISGDSNLRNCKRVWGMSNTINNIPMYSTGLYMCVEATDGSILALPETLNPPTDIKTIVKHVKNSSNFTNHSKFLSNSSNLNFFNNTNKTFHLQNFTNNTNISSNISIHNLATSPSGSTTTTSIPTTTTTTTTTSSTSTSPTTATTKTNVITTTPSNSITTTPSAVFTTTQVIGPAPSPTHNIDNIDNNYPSRLFNETNKNEEDINNEKEEMNPLLPTVIILSSIVGCCILSGIGFYVYKNGCCRGKKCSKTLPEAQAEKVHDLESGEKNENKNRNSWTVMTTTLKTRKKLKELQSYKNKKALKPKLKSSTKAQIEKQKKVVNVKKYPNQPPGMGGIRHIETKKRDNKLVRSHMEEQASRIPGGLNNASLQRMMKRFPKSPRQKKLDSMNLDMSSDQQKWYKDQFGNELNSMIDNPPYTPPALPPNEPPPPPPDTARKQMNEIKRVVYGNKQNDNSPKMTIRELNPEEN